MPASVVALFSPGAMGAAVGARLTAAGLVVKTSLAGRGARSAERAANAGMIPASDAELAEANLILSIVPPAEAAPLAERLAPHLAVRLDKPLYVDANALSPASKRALAARLAGVGCAMVDGAIIGQPPRRDDIRTVLHLSGPRAAEALVLNVPGFEARVIDGPIGAAAALKMCFAGINKGVVALAATMMLAAERNGAADALRREMIEGMPDLFKRYQRQIPDMFPKAYRWIAEMREIGEFLHDDAAGAAILEGFAQRFEQVADDMSGLGHDAEVLTRAIRAD